MALKWTFQQLSCTASFCPKCHSIMSLPDDSDNVSCYECDTVYSSERKMSLEDRCYKLSIDLPCQCYPSVKKLIRIRSDTMLKHSCCPKQMNRNRGRS